MVAKGLVIIDDGEAPPFWAQATRALRRRDPVLRKLIATNRGLAIRSRGDAFATLARAIVGQQISVKAAQSVWQKFATMVEIVEPARVTAASLEKLRLCGLSGSKCLYLQDLARRFLDGSLHTELWNRQDDEEIIAELVKVKGIGRWTAEMFLIFYLMRPDVLPLDDMGLQRSIRLNYGAGEAMTKAEMIAIADAWSPWRSVATWYLWRSIEPIPVDY